MRSHYADTEIGNFKLMCDFRNRVGGTCNNDHLNVLLIQRIPEFQAS